MDKRLEILNWLSSERFNDAYDSLQSSHVQGSGSWFLQSIQFQDWFKGTANLFVVAGNRMYPMAACINNVQPVLESPI